MGRQRRAYCSKAGVAGLSACQPRFPQDAGAKNKKKVGRAGETGLSLPHQGPHSWPTCLPPLAHRALHAKTKERKNMGQGRQVRACCSKAGAAGLPAHPAAMLHINRWE